MILHFAGRFFLIAPLRRRRVLVYISLFRVANSVNYTSELREFFQLLRTYDTIFTNIIFKIKHKLYIYISSRPAPLPTPPHPTPPHPNPQRKILIVHLISYIFQVIPSFTLVIFRFLYTVHLYLPQDLTQLVGLKPCIRRPNDVQLLLTSP